MAKAKRPPEANGVSYLYDMFVAGKPEQELGYCESAADSEVAGAVYQMRENAGLTQAQLAKMIGTTKSAISRLEDSNYQGHSMGMLRRIGNALGYHVSVSFTPIKKANKSRAQVNEAAPPKKSAKTLPAKQKSSAAAPTNRVRVNNRPAKLRSSK